MHECEKVGVEAVMYGGNQNKTGKKGEERGKRGSWSGPNAVCEACLMS